MRKTDLVKPPVDTPQQADLRALYTRARETYAAYVKVSSEESRYPSKVRAAHESWVAAEEALTEGGGTGAAVRELLNF